jgi:membrane protein
MAQLRDVPKVLRSVGVIGFGKRVYHQMQEDQVLVWAAALAYSWLFAIFPFLIFLLTLTPYLPDRYTEPAVDQITEWVDQYFPTQVAQTVNAEVQRVVRHRAEGLLSIGLLITIWVASGGMSMTMYALDKCYDIDQGRSYVKHRAVAIGLTLAVATMIILVVILMPVSTALLAWLRLRAEDVGIMIWVNRVARYATAVVIMLFMLAALFFIGPRRRRRYTRRGAAIGLGLVVLIFFIAGYMTKPAGVPLSIWFSSEQRLVWSFAFILIDTLRYAAAMVLLMLVLAVVYYFGPSIRHRFHILTPGALFSFTIWLLLILAFRYYVNNFAWESYQRMYGTVGLAALLLLFFYVDAVVLLVGAEINSEIDFAVIGIPSGVTEEEQAVAQTPQTEEEVELAEELRAKRDPETTSA